MPEPIEDSIVTWNHRVVRRVYSGAAKSDEVVYAIHEAYYAPDRTCEATTVEPVAVVGESVEDLRATLQQMLRALDAPVLDYETRQELPG